MESGLDPRLLVVKLAHRHRIRGVELGNVAQQLQRVYVFQSLNQLVTQRVPAGCKASGQGVKRGKYGITAPVELWENIVAQDPLDPRRQSSIQILPEYGPLDTIAQIDLLGVQEPKQMHDAMEMDLDVRTNPQPSFHPNQEQYRADRGIDRTIQRAGEITVYIANGLTFTGEELGVNPTLLPRKEKGEQQSADEGRVLEAGAKDGAEVLEGESV
jgi:hypothetical protein